MVGRAVHHVSLNVTDTAVLMGAVIYATIPATRYMIEGLRGVSPALQDAGSMSGVNAAEIPPHRP